MSSEGTERIAVLVADARVAYEAGRMDEARGLLRSALAVSPSSPSVRELVARLFPELLEQEERPAIESAAWGGVDEDEPELTWCDALPEPGPPSRAAPEPPAAPGLDLLRGSSARGTGSAAAQVAAEQAGESAPAEDEVAAPDPVDEEVEGLLEGARELFELADFSSSLELVEKALALRPDHPDAREYLERNQETLVHMYESKVGDMSRIPSLAVASDEVVWLSLDHRAGFLLAQIDGKVSFEDLYALSGMSRLDTSRILARLLDEGVID